MTQRVLPKASSVTEEQKTDCFWSRRQITMQDGNFSSQHQLGSKNSECQGDLILNGTLCTFWSQRNLKDAVDKRGWRSGFWMGRWQRFRKRDINDVYKRSQWPSHLEARTLRHSENLVYPWILHFFSRPLAHWDIVCNILFLSHSEQGLDSRFSALTVCWNYSEEY